MVASGLPHRHGDYELWFFVCCCCYHEQAVEQRAKLPSFETQMKHQEKTDLYSGHANLLTHCYVLSHFRLPYSTTAKLFTHQFHLPSSLGKYNTCSEKTGIIHSIPWETQSESLQGRPMAAWDKGWWCHDMEVDSTLLALCEGNRLPLASGFPTQRASNVTFDVLFYGSLNVLFNKQWSCQWLEMLWHSSDVTVLGWKNTWGKEVISVLYNNWSWIRVIQEARASTAKVLT